jgi:hypothetical protein
MESILKAAIKYRNQGFSVIPMVSIYNQKENKCDKKALDKWGQYQKTLPTIKEIAQWWGKWPNAMVGIITGELSGIMVVDADTKEACELIEKTIPENMDSFAIAESPRGGRHYYFKCINGKWQTKAGVLPDIDIRANGGIICAPPSINIKGGKYGWISELNREMLDEMPAALEELLSAAQQKPKFAVDVKDVGSIFTPGRRDTDLFHLALALRKAGETKEYTFSVLKKITEHWADTNDDKLLLEKVKSAFTYEEKKERNLTDEIRQWIGETNGDFDYKACDFDLDLKSKAEKTNRRKIFNRMKNENIIIGIHGKNGWFRRVENIVDYANYVDVAPSYIAIDMPLGISNIVKFSPKSIVVVAGSTNSGKTTFFLNIVKENDFNFVYFNSEMSVNKFRGRLDDFELPIEFWNKKMKMVERVYNIADAIHPNDINIIDFLETDWEKPYLAAGKIREIFDKLDQGMAIIGLQKKRDATIPRGGEGTLEKAQFAIALDYKKEAGFYTAEILKAKEPAKKDFNPNFCICDFTYNNNNTTFQKINEWRQQ